MAEPARIGIILCDRYRDCAGGKCFRSARRREGAFSVYAGREIEIVGYTTCGGCPGGNIEYCPDEMKKNGAETIHLATGMIVGYPPCPYIASFCDVIRLKYGMDVIVGTHPIPQNYWMTHEGLGTWKTSEWQEIIRATQADESTRIAYD